MIKFDLTISPPDLLCVFTNQSGLEMRRGGGGERERGERERGREREKERV